MLLKVFWMRFFLDKVKIMVTTFQQCLMKGTLRWIELDTG